MKAKSFADRHAKPRTVPDKAGVMLCEDIPAGADAERPGGGRKLLMSVNEGRFSRNGDFYVLPKGSIDKGETMLHAGIRELGEETGFDLASFLGQENIARLEAGKALYNITNPVYPGVTIIEFDPRQAIQHDYHSRTGHIQPMVMYGVKVKGIDNLGRLKNAERTTTKQFLDANPAIPRFPTMLQWLEQGYIPADKSGQRVPLVDPQWFADMIAQHAPQGSLTRDDWHATRAAWQQFCVALEKDDKPAYKQLREAFETIQTYLKKEGLLQGDKAILKFDTKDCPLYWYTEAGHVGYARDILTQIFTNLRDTDDYARAFGGAGTLEKDLKPHEQIVLGQVASLVPYASPKLWRAASNEVYGETGKFINALVHHGAQMDRRAMQSQMRG